MEFGKLKSLMWIVVFLAVISNVYSRTCYVGESGASVEKLDCYDTDVTYCVKYADYTFKDTYFFCDYTTMCKAVGFKNSTAAGITCCNTDICNSP